jgi:activator of 2-hydroxyglutaryl-CoA dehydratase
LETSSYAGIDFGSLSDKSIVVPDFQSRYEATLWANENKSKVAIDAVVEKLKELTTEYNTIPSKTSKRLEMTRKIGWYANALEVMQRYGATVYFGVTRIK